MPTPSPGLTCGVRFLDPFRLLDGDADVEGGSGAGLTLKVYAYAVRLFHKLLRNRHPQPGPDAHRLRGEPACKDLVAMLGFDPFARVCNRNVDEIPLAPRADRDLPFAFDGLPGVHQNIEKN